MSPETVQTAGQSAANNPNVRVWQAHLRQTAQRGTGFGHRT